jgi:transcriptional regulator with XRE-family HTH domain
MTTFAQAFGERLIVARFNFGRISQEALAERASVHRTQISMLEGGRRLPRLDTFVKLAGAVDLSPGELLGTIRWEPSVRAPGFFVLGEEEG